MVSNKSHLTAIARKTLPVPTRWLIKQGLIKPPVMDYGCGHCQPINPLGWLNYDPYFFKINLRPFWGSIQTVVCNYVLCTLPARERTEVLLEIQNLLMNSPAGVAYVSVRNDRPKNGWGISSRGTYQGRVRGLNLPIIYQCAQFRIYKLTKDAKVL